MENITQPFFLKFFKGSFYLDALYTLEHFLSIRGGYNAARSVIYRDSALDNTCVGEISHFSIIIPPEWADNKSKKHLWFNYRISKVKTSENLFKKESGN